MYVRRSGAAAVERNDSMGRRGEGRESSKGDTLGEQVQRYQRIMGNMSKGMIVQIPLLSSLSSDLTRAMRTGKGDASRAGVNGGEAKEWKGGGEKKKSRAGGG